MRKFISMGIRDISGLGSIVFTGVAFFVLLIFGFYNIGLQIVTGHVIIYVVSVPIKYFYKKKRPKERTYNNIIEKIDASSFPSIHAARITSLAIIFGYFGKNTVFTVLLIILVLIVCYSRIHLKHHDLKDVIAGISTGLIAGIIAVMIM